MKGESTRIVHGGGGSLSTSAPDARVGAATPSRSRTPHGPHCTQRAPPAGLPLTPLGGSTMKNYFPQKCSKGPVTGLAGRAPNAGGRAGGRRRREAGLLSSPLENGPPKRVKKKQSLSSSFFFF